MARKLTRIIGITFGVQIAVFSFGLVNNILLSRWLGPEPLGKVAILFLIAELIYKVTNMGLETSTSYYISNRKIPFQVIIGNISVLIIGVIALSVLFSKLVFQSGFVQLFINHQVTAPALPGYGWTVLLILGYLSYDYGTKILLGRQEFIQYNKMQFIRPILLFVLLVSTYLFGYLTLIMVLFIYSLSWMIPGILMWQTALPTRPQINPRVVWNMVKYGTKIMLTNLITFLNYRADIFLVGYFGTNEMVGWYYVATVIAEKMNYISQSTNTILFPAASHSEEQQRKTPIYTRVNFFLILIFSLVMAIIAPFVIPLLYSLEYSNSILPLIVLLPGVTALTLPKVLSADFAARGKPHISMYITMVIFAVNVTLNILLIPRLGIVGAAIASSIAYILAAILMSYFYKRLTGTPIRQLFIIKRGDWKQLKKI